jgi:hypothetical protein
MATLPDFSVGQVLTAAHMDAVGLWLVKTQTVGTGVSSVTVTGAFSADFDNYRITWTGGNLSASDSLRLQFGPSSVPGYSSSYETGLNYGTPAASAFAYNSSGTFVWVGGGGATTAWFFVELLNPFLPEYTRMLQGAYQSGSAFGNSYGVHSQTESYTDFTISTAIATTMTGGTIRVYGYRN